MPEKFNGPVSFKATGFILESKLEGWEEILESLFENPVVSFWFPPNPPVPNLYKSNEFWLSPDEKESKKAMRWYYENKDIINRTAGIDVGKEFDYKVIGKQMKESLNE